MRVSIELFLLDNFIMDFLMLRIAAVLIGGKIPLARLLSASAAGTVYALAALSIAPFLNSFWVKLLFGAGLAWMLVPSPEQVIRAALSVFVASCVMAGGMLLIVLLFGGSFENGTYFAPVPVRIALSGIALASVLPRVFLTMVHAVRTRSRLGEATVVFKDRVLTVSVLIDSGNLLTEPISGKPVMLVRPKLLSTSGGRIVPYRTVHGGGLLTAVKPVRVTLRCGHDTFSPDIYVAGAEQDFRGADAILGSIALCRESEEEYETDTEAYNAAESTDTDTVRKGDSLHPLGRDAAAAVCPGGGEKVDREADAGRYGSEERAD